MRFRQLLIATAVAVLAVPYFVLGNGVGALGPRLSGYFPYLSASDGFVYETATLDTGRVVPHPTDGGIREVVPDKFRSRYESWRNELLSTDFGKSQWDRYASNKDFILTVVVSGSKEKGAGTDKLLWDDQGNLVGATITLGADIEAGYPSPIYYPVLNSLSNDSPTYTISGKILAATKFSHEIGHVNQASIANMKFLQLQNKLMPEYNEIMLKNGFNGKDKKLLDLAAEMKGTPVEIWESREYWSEVNAMLYLTARINKEDFYCSVFKRIRYNVESYARNYEERFLDHPEFAASPCFR